MTHLPLTLGEHTTASGPVTITGIGKSCKRAYSDNCGWWHVETGEHRRDPALDITGRVEPAGFDVQMREVREIAIEAELARVTAERDRAIAAAAEKAQDAQDRFGASQDALIKTLAERDEAVALLWRWHSIGFVGVMVGPDTAAFLAKIGGKPAEARNSQSDISTAHDALLALEMLKERQTGDSSGGSWSRGWDAGLDAAIKVVANLTEAKP